MADLPVFILFVYCNFTRVDFHYSPTGRAVRPLRSAILLR
jgi:DNA mismatch repair ATPase MutL